MCLLLLSLYLVASGVGVCVPFYFPSLCVCSGLFLGIEFRVFSVCRIACRFAFVSFVYLL